MSSQYPLFQFLENNKAQKGGPHTHTSMGKPFGSFNITDDKLTEFYELYKNHIADHNQAHIIEKHKSQSSVLVDIDFKFKNDITDRQYTETHIYNLVDIYNEAIKSVVNINNESRDLIAFVFQKSKPYLSNETIKDGIHIIYPSIITTPDAQYAIRDMVISKINENNIFDDIPYINDIQDVVDKQVIFKNGWMMAKSSKPDCEIYNPTFVFDSYGYKIKFDEVDYKGMENNMAEFFSIRRYNKDDCCQIKDESLTDKYNIKKTTNIKFNNDKPKDMNLIKKLIDNLEPFRSDDFEDWINVCMILVNECNNEQGFNLFIDFSKKSKKFDFEKCKSKWNEISNQPKPSNPITLGTLHHMSKSDNPEKYKEIKKSNKPYSGPHPMIQGLVKLPTHKNCANMFITLYSKYIVCVDQQKQLFYLYDHPSCLWKMKCASSLYNIVSNVLEEELLKLLDYNNEKASEDSDDDDDDAQAILLVMSKKIKAIIKDIAMKSFISGVISFLSSNDLIFDDEFRLKITSKTNILSVKNGIVDLRTGTLRPRRYDDYQVNNIELDYNPENISNDWHEFLIELFTHPNISDTAGIVKYIQKLFGYLITKDTSGQVMLIANGNGGNGKSVVSNVFQSVFDCNMAKIDESLIDKAQKQNANAASPEIAKLFNKTTAFIEEVEDDTELGKRFKQLVDGGKLTCRELYGSPYVFQNTTKIMMNTNYLPSFKSSDAFLRRIIILNYLNKYSYEDEMEDGDRLRDDKKEFKLLQNKEGILSWFVNGAVRFYNENGVGNIHPELRAFKTELKTSNDWMNDIIFTNDPNDRIYFKDLDETIKDVLGDNHGMKRKDITKSMKSKGAELGKSGASRFYKGARIEGQTAHYEMD